MALVPPNHPLIAPPSLEPEASGLLDRLLSVFQEMQRYGSRHDILENVTDGLQ